MDVNIKVNAEHSQVEKATTALKILRGELVQVGGRTVNLGEGFTKAQANMLATMRQAGATTKELKSMGKVMTDLNKIMGTNPFDKSANALAFVKKQREELQKTIKFSEQYNDLTKQQLALMFRGIEAVRQRAQSEGQSFGQREAAVKKFIAQFTEEARALNKLNNEVEENNRLHAERVRQEANTRAAMERRMRSEATMMNQAVQQFHKAQQDKARAAQKTADQQAVLAQRNINNIDREIQKLREQAAAMRQGQSTVTGNVVFRLTQAGASPQQIAEARQLRKEIEELGRAARQSENKFWGLQGVDRKSTRLNSSH